MKAVQKITGGLVALVFATAVLADIRLNDGTVLSDSPAWVVAYIEVASDSVSDARALIQAQVLTGKKEDSNLRFEGVQRSGRDNHFAILEAWASPAAQEAHAAASQTQAFRAALAPMLYAPYDERPHAGLTASVPDSTQIANATSVYVITHADIIPPEQFAPCNRMSEPSGPCGNDLLIQLAKSSREHAGNQRFDILTQVGRTNHMTVVETWDSASNQSQHQERSDKKRFRDGFAAISGSLWDERVYRLID